MAPLNEHCVTTALSATALSHDESTVLVEAGGFTPMKWFLSQALNPASATEDVSEPPAKRRKLGESRSVQCAVPDPAQHIPISRVAIDLDFPTTLNARSVGSAQIREDVSFKGAESVKVDASFMDRFDAHRLRLALPRLNGEVLVVDVTELPDYARGALRHAALTRLREAEIATGHDPTYWKRCTLTASSGQPFTVVRLEINFYWNSGASAFSSGVPGVYSEQKQEYKLLFGTFPDVEKEEAGLKQDWSPRDFYECVHVPPKDQDTTYDFQSLLDSDLYPFQKRAVHWMLRREGMKYECDGLHALQDSKRARNVDFYRPIQDVDGGTCFVNHLQGIICRTRPDPRMSALSGGILAEEMGLGKTVELMALLSVHKRADPLPEAYYDGDSEMEIVPSRATLIITPNSILQQWKSELTRHAPALRVFHYEGFSSKKPKAEQQILKEMTVNDVVLATYSTLTRELHFAEDPPKRDMRQARKYKRKRSPLVRLQWWRICLDEAQMVESGVSAAARVARRLLSVHRWAVSGTPLRKDVQDLHGLLIFLGLQPLADNTKLWKHLIHSHGHLFRKVFNTIALRHSKIEVGDDIQLPQQKRVVVTIPFSATEQANYNDLFKKMCHAVGVGSDGSPNEEDWDPTDPAVVEEMRSQLVQLRQACLHPQVGAKNRKALGRGRGPLRTVAEVLEVMIEQNETTLRTEERALLATQLLRGHVVGNAQENDRRSVEALEIYRPAMEKSAELVKESREKLAATKELRRDKGEVVTETDDEDSADETTPEVGRLKNSLRTALQLEHTCTFFAATAIYQQKTNIDITEPETERYKSLEDHETALYEHAKQLRKEILQDSSRKSEVFMQRIGMAVEQKKFTKMPRIKELESLGGIESRRITEKSDELFDKIREQGALIADWRAKMAEYLLKPLVDTDEGLETTGDEYEDSTKLQDELFVYFDAVKAILADLQTSITGEKAPLIDHEMLTMVRAARTALDKDIVEEMKNQGVHAPELTLELLGTRNKLRGGSRDGLSIRGLIQEARGLEASLQGNESGIRAAERAILRQHINALQATFSSYNKALTGVQREVDLFRLTQNQRLDFYRQLQELSDAVQPYKEELDPTLDMVALQDATSHEESQTEALKQLRSKHTFLLHLREKDNVEDRDETCVICNDTFLSGVLTVCGHKYCKECAQNWLGMHKKCAVCRRKMTPADMHNITYKPLKLAAREEIQSGSSSPSDQDSSPKQNSIYSGVSSQLLQEIQSIDLPTSYGTKIDTLGRHLHWLREHDPGAKSVVFSQYREFLDVLGTALSDFRIGYARLGRGSAVEKFKQDPTIDCLLLDAKTDSSGMTLVNATHVFICEPLIQTAVELQAIARVHRIGQTRPTTVWMYLISDTVEEAIYDISVTRRLAHAQARQSNRAQKSRSATPAPLQENAIDAANSEEMQSAPLSKLLVAGKGGGELVGKEDLWQCLFGKAQKSGVKTSVEEHPIVSRHLRAEAAEQRRSDAMELD
ncbi:uncharacterized protein LTR77_002309 [Saxophila tyrrhenica]|uniref:Uncharacterized protein n=1 Tax=Saxophila tyrrhenica TaxID=1690608 RepID=A0AAV9PJ59_9PEZI|nr:hypothetical protein LTR77_002309 [Saxophila tyrrhenica]